MPLIPSKHLPKPKNPFLTAEDFRRYESEEWRETEPPIVPKNTYTGCQPIHRHIHGVTWSGGEFAPIIMRGCLRSRIMRHSLSTSGSANGYALAVVDRYLRKIKFTSVSIKEINQVRQNLIYKMGDRYHLTYHAYDRYVLGDYVYVNGEMLHKCELPPGSLGMLKSLARVVRKIDKEAA